MLRIGDFSKLARVSIRMLRHYDEIGLLTPAEIDRFTAYRYYSEDQLPIAAQITSLKDMGFGLAAIGELMTHADEPEALAQALRLKQGELSEQADKTARQLQLVNTAMMRLRKDRKTMIYNVTLKELPQRPVISVRKIIPNYWNEGMLWKIMMEETAPLHVQYSEPCYATALFHDDGYKESDVDVEVQMSVKGTYPNTENVVFKTEPPVLVASATCKGSYELMGEVNQSIAGWIRDNGYQLNGSAFNIYHVSPQQTQNPDEYVTEVCYPVVKK